MNFVGRYYTVNRTLVAVHLAVETVEGDCKYKGHEIRLVPPFSDDRMFAWNAQGKCTWIFGTVDDTSKYDLVQMVNPQSYAASVEVIGCEECHKVKAERC